MRSERQVDANRLNFQESTALRTREGQDRLRFNAVTLGTIAKVDARSGRDDDTAKLVSVAVAVESSTESGVPPDHGITRNEPNSPSIDTPAVSCSKRRVLYRDDRKTSAKPRKRHLRRRRIHWRAPLNAARSSRAFGGGSPHVTRPGWPSRQKAVGCERPPGCVESRHDPARALGRRGHSGGFIRHEIGGWCASADGTEIAAL
jgi:hypothetical protein